MALVTGASSGVGRALAVELGGRGWSVGLVARRAEELETVAAEVSAAGGRGLPLVTDVAEPRQVGAAAAECVETLGPVDLVVANAGTSEVTSGRALDAGTVERILRVNYLGAVYLVESVLPSMLERRSGWVVGVSSLTAFRGLPLTAGYSASKAALSNFLESLRIDLRGTGVGVTTAHLGYVRTPMIEDAAYRQPFRIEADDAARRILTAVRRGRGDMSTGGPLSWLTFTAQVFPWRMYDWIASRVDRNR